MSAPPSFSSNQHIVSQQTHGAGGSVPATSAAMTPSAPELPLDQIAMQGSQFTRLLRESVGRTFQLLNDPEESSDIRLQLKHITDELSKVKKSFE